MYNHVLRYGCRRPLLLCASKALKNRFNSEQTASFRTKFLPEGSESYVRLVRVLRLRSDFPKANFQTCFKLVLKRLYFKRPHKPFAYISAIHQEVKKKEHMHRHQLLRLCLVYRPSASRLFYLVGCRLLDTTFRLTSGGKLCPGLKLLLRYPTSHNWPVFVLFSAREWWMNICWHLSGVLFLAHASWELPFLQLFNCCSSSTTIN